MDNFGEEITNATQIAKHYVMSFSFAIDLLALAANPLTESLGQIRFVGILKINRVFRLKQLITEANMDKFNKAICKIVYFAFILYVYIHLTACLWYFVVKDKRQWVPPFHFIDYTANDLWVTESNTRKYWICVYYCVLVLGGNELGPSNNNELIYIVSINLIGAIVNAQIFGELAVLLSQLNRKDASY